MDRHNIVEIARSAMGGRKGLLTRETGYLFYHGHRVAEIAMRLAAAVEDLDVEADVLYAAALFHDVCKGFPSHAETGAELARILLNEAFEPDSLNDVARLIGLHNKRREGHESAGVRVLQDADVLDHVGAQSAWLCFLYNAYTEGGPVAAADYYQSEENARFLSGMRDSLNFERSREAFDRRIAVESAFFQRFRDELNGEL
ncbi:MAG TPA: HD domain-containing protein [Armatimonadota bacterium]